MAKADRFMDRFLKKKQKDDWAQAAMPTDEELPPPGPQEQLKADKNPGRNDPCPCGSGKKYKKCCGQKP